MYEVRVLPDGRFAADQREQIVVELRRRAGDDGIGVDRARAPVDVGDACARLRGEQPAGGGVDGGRPEEDVRSDPAGRNVGERRRSCSTPQPE